MSRFHTLEQAKFDLEHPGADFAEYARKHAAHVDARAIIEEALAGRIRTQWLERRLLPNYLFAPDDIVVGRGQGGFIANPLTYLGGQLLPAVSDLFVAAKTHTSAR